MGEIFSLDWFHKKTDNCNFQVNTCAYKIITIYLNKEKPGQCVLLLSISGALKFVCNGWY